MDRQTARVPWGHMAEDFADNRVLNGMCGLPQLFEVADLDQAPDSFLESLAQHVNEKTGLNPAKGSWGRFGQPESSRV